MENKVKISTQDLNLYYGENHALKNINLDLYENKITAFIGPSGCGKSTYLKTLNRMNDLVSNVKIDGTVLLDGEDIYDPQVDTEVLLMDEPTSALDPISTLKIEDLMDDLKSKYTVAIVTHNMQQATRIADYTAFFLVGEVVEYATTDELFTLPKDKRTEDYITGRFG